MIAQPFLPGVSSEQSQSLHGDVIQVCLVVEDLRRSMEDVTRVTGAGPWFVQHHQGSAPQPSYRGEPRGLHAKIALGYAKDLMYELVEPDMTRPSIFEEVMRQKGPGLHHLGIETQHFDELYTSFTGVEDSSTVSPDVAEVVFFAQTPRGARVFMIEEPTLGSLIEYIEVTPDGASFYKRMREAARTWDMHELIAT